MVIVVSITTVTATNILLYDLHPSTKLSPVEIYECAHLLGALSGLANRDAPRLVTI